MVSRTEGNGYATRPACSHAIARMNRRVRAVGFYALARSCALPPCRGAYAYIHTSLARWPRVDKRCTRADIHPHGTIGRDGRPSRARGGEGGDKRR